MPASVMPDKRVPPDWWDNYLYRAGTIGELAGKLGIDASRLAGVIAEMNGYAATGVDPQFGRGGEVYDRYFGDARVRPNPCLGAISKPPYYAIRIDLGDLGTKGGLKADQHARVLDRQWGTNPGTVRCGQFIRLRIRRLLPGCGRDSGSGPDVCLHRRQRYRHASYHWAVSRRARGRRSDTAAKYARFAAVASLREVTLRIDRVGSDRTRSRFATKTLRCGALMALSIGHVQLAAAADMDGAALYREHCASCHASDLTGGAGPALSGFVFADHWVGKNAVLYESISKTMPLDAPGTLSAEENRSITDYILRYNKLRTRRPMVRKRSSGTAAHSAPQIILPAAAKRFATATSTEPGDEELKNPSSGDWLYYNLSLTGQRYSALRQITPQNVRQLAPKCIFQTGEIGSFQSSPIVRKGLMYITTAHRTYALDASTAENFGRTNIRRPAPSCCRRIAGLLFIKAW